MGRLRRWKEHCTADFQPKYKLYILVVVGVLRLATQGPEAGITQDRGGC